MHVYYTFAYLFVGIKRSFLIMGIGCSKLSFFPLNFFGEVSCFDSGVPLLLEVGGSLQLYYGPRAANLEESVVCEGKKKVCIIPPEHRLSSQTGEGFQGSILE